MLIVGEELGCSEEAYLHEMVSELVDAFLMPAVETVAVCGALRLARSRQDDFVRIVLKCIEFGGTYSERFQTDRWIKLLIDMIQAPG